MSTEIILLERVENLGQMGEIVRVRPGYARNFLLPQGKALRATKTNVAFFEGQRANLEALDQKKKTEAATKAKKLDGLKVVVVRQASEGGQLYGSVTSRDITDAIIASGVEVARNQVTLNQAFKKIGLFPVTVSLHPEVKVDVIVNIARTEAEAATQAKTGKALIADYSAPAPRSAPKAEVAEQAAPAAEATTEEDAA